MRSNIKSSRGKIVIWIVVLLLLAVIIAGGFYYKDKFLKPKPTPTPSPQPKYDARVLTVGVDSRPTAMLFYAVNHFIPANKFKVVPVLLEDPNERWSRMKAGALDLCVATLPEYVLGSVRHKPGKVLMFISSSAGCDGIAVNPGINSVDDMLGKNVAVVPGSASHYLLIKVLDSQGKSTSEIKIVPCPTQKDVFKGFTEGSFIDAASLWDPYLSNTTNSKKRILVDTKRYFSIDEILCAGDFTLENRKEDIQTLVNSYFNLVYLIQTNPGLAKSLITKTSGRSIKDVEMLFSSVRLRDLEASRSIPVENIVSGMKKIQQIWGIEGLPNSSGKVDFEKTLDFRFLENANVNTSLFEDSPPPDIVIEPSPMESPEPGPPPVVLSPAPVSTPPVVITLSPVPSPIPSPAVAPVINPAASPSPAESTPETPTGTL